MGEYFDNPEIYNRVSQSEEQRKEAFFVYYKNYINKPLYKADKKGYATLLGKEESMLKGLSDVNKNILVISNSNIDREVFLTLFSKKERFTSNRYVNAPQVYDVYWDKAGRDNQWLDDSEIVYSTQNYNEDVLCVYMSTDQYVRGVGPILNSLFDSRYNRINSKGERLLTWVFFRGTVENMNEDKDFKLPYNYFINMNNTGDFIILDLNKSNSGVVLPKLNTNQANNSNSLSDIY